VVEHQLDGLHYQYVTYDAGTSGCTETMLFTEDSSTKSQVSVALDPESSATRGTGSQVIAYVTSANCDPRKVTFNLGYEGSAVWKDISMAGCDISPLQVLGSVVADGGDALIVYGGHSEGATSNPGTVCLVDGVSSPPGTASTIVGEDDVHMQVWDMIRHPQLKDLYFFGGLVKYDALCSTTTYPCSVPGLYALQRMDAPGGGERWDVRRISDDDFETPEILTLDWGTAPAALGFWSPYMAHVYTGGIGTWDLELTW
jgi:hypothetical protein